VLLDDEDLADVTEGHAGLDVMGGDGRGWRWTQQKSGDSGGIAVEEEETARCVAAAVRGGVI
jgi:hypothetical protein